MRGIPDIVLKVDDRPALVLDTKYKVIDAKPVDADFHQMISYCHGMGLSHGILVYPGSRSQDRFVFKDIMVDVLFLDLTGDLATFRSRCSAFALALQDTVRMSE